MTRYEGLIEWSDSAGMPDITEQPTPCRSKKAKLSPAKDSLLEEHSTVQDYVQNMMDLEQTEHSLHDLIEIDETDLNAIS